MEKNQILKKLTFMIVLIGFIVVLGLNSFAQESSDKELAQGDYSGIDVTLLNQDPDPAVQGDYVDLRFKVVKADEGDVEKLTFSLNYEYPFSLDPTNFPEKKIEENRGSSVNTKNKNYHVLDYKLLVDKNAAKGVYYVSLFAQYEGMQKKKVGVYEIRLDDNDVPEFVLGGIESSPSELTSDLSEVQLDIEVTNIEDVDAENVIATILLPEGFTPSYTFSDRANLATLSASETATASFYVDIDEDVNEEQYKARMKIEYKEANDEDNNYKSVSFPIDISMANEARFEITGVETNPNEIKELDKVTLKLTIENTGTKDAEAVSIKAYKESSMPFEFDEKSDYIGKLEIGKSSEAILSFEVEEGAIPKKYMMDIDVEYKDDEDNSFVSQKSITFEVMKMDQENKNLLALLVDLFFGNGKNPFVVILVFFVILIIAAGSYYFGKSKGKE